MLCHLIIICAQTSEATSFAVLCREATQVRAVPSVSAQHFPGLPAGPFAKIDHHADSILIVATAISFEKSFGLFRNADRLEHRRRSRGRGRGDPKSYRTETDIILLDFSMPNMNGIEAACVPRRLCRSSNRNVYNV